MPGIPTYEKRLRPQSLPGVARVQTDSSGLRDLGHGIQSLGASLAGAVADENQKQQQKLNDQDMLTASNALSAGDEYWNQYSTEAKQGWTVGGEDLRTKSNQDFDAWKSQQAAALNTEKGKAWFDQHAEQMRSRLNQDFYNYQDRAGTEKVAADTKVGMDLDYQTIAANPDSYESVTARRIEALNATARIPEAMKTQIAAKYQQEAAQAAERGALWKNPQAWLATRVSPQAARVEQAGAVSNAVSPDVFDIGVIGQESGGKQFDKNGNPLTSSAGAIGIAQVMPGTAPEAARLAGVPYDEQRYRNDADYNKALGKAYFNKQLETFGNVPMALAAYNAGPGAVQKAVANGGGDWLAQLPEETQKYVKSITAKVGAGQGGTSGGSDNSAGITIAPDAPETFKTVDYVMQHRLIEEAQTLVKQQAAQQRGEVDRQLADATAMHKDGKQDPFDFSIGRMVATYGAEGPRVYAQYKASQAMASDVASYSTKSDAEIVASLQATAPKPGEGYAAEDARQAIRIQAAQAQIKARNDDPAAYVLKNSKKVADAARTAQAGGAPASIAYAGASLAEQQRLGVKAPRVLTNDQADQIAGQFQDQSKGSANAAELMASLQTQYGAYFPQVYQQLQASEKMPPEAIVIPNMKDAVSRSNMAAVAKIKDAELKAMLPDGAEKDVEENMLSLMQEFQTTTVGMQGGGARTFAMVQQSAAKLAKYYVASGKSPKEAAKQAYEETIGHAYQFEGSYRIPTAEQPDLVVDGVELVTQGADKLPVMVPRAPAGMRPADAEAQYREALKDNIVFATNQDESGVLMYAKTPTGLVPVLDKAGQQYGYDWQDLRNRATLAKQASNAAREKQQEERRSNLATSNYGIKSHYTPYRYQGGY